MLVNPSSLGMMTNKGGNNSISSRGMSSPTGSSCSSVRLRRRNNQKELEATKRRNRHSGDIGNWSPRILSPRGFKDSLLEEGKMRKSGDWSYVSFPSSSPGTPKAPFPRNCGAFNSEEGPASLLESKIIASIMENESRSVQGSPARYHPRLSSTPPPPPRCRSAMETLDRKISAGSVGVRRKLLGGESKIEEEEEAPPIFFDKYGASSKNTVAKVKRRSQSTHHNRQDHHRFSEVIETRSVRSESNQDERRRPLGLGRRSATQLELSRRKKSPDDQERRRVDGEESSQFSRWKSQEHVDQLFINESYDEDDDRNTGERDENVSYDRRSDYDDERPGFERRDFEEDYPSSTTTLKKGLLWQQRDKIFSRWKERFFILTKDYLQCFKKESNSRLSEMGGFIFKLKLAEVESVDLVDKRGYLTVSLSLPKEGKVLLRKNEGIKDWFQLLKSCVNECRAKNCMKSSEEFWSRKNFQDSPSNSPTNLDHWILARQRIGQHYNYINTGAITASEDFMSLPVVSSPIAADYYHRKSRQLKDITSPLTNHRTPSKSRRSSRNNHHSNYPDIGSPCDSPRDNQRKSLFVSENNFDSGNDSMNTNTSTGGSTDSSNRGVRSRSKSRGPIITENDYESLKPSKEKFRGRSTTDVQRANKLDIEQKKLNYRRSHFLSPGQSTRV